MSSISFSDFIESAESGMVSDVVIKGNAIQGHYNNGGAFDLRAQRSGVVDRLTKAGVRFRLDRPKTAIPACSASSRPGSQCSCCRVWIFFMRQMQGGTGKAMGFGKSQHADGEDGPGDLRRRRWHRRGQAGA